MARVQVQLPERFSFSVEMPLLGIHINFGGHLDNALMLTLVSEARLRFIESIGYTWEDVAGVSIIIADAEIEYKSEGFYGDLVRVELAYDQFHDKGFDMLWRISNVKTGAEIARGKQGTLTFDRTAKRVVAIPEELRSRLQAL
jgi:4-hydroxybenzoyl-CoA thioesterase